VCRTSEVCIKGRFVFGHIKLSEEERKEKIVIYTVNAVGIEGHKVFSSFCWIP
jgi:hypothetical protein